MTYRTYTEPIERLTQDEIQSIVHGLFSDCEQFVDGELSPERERASRYYRGEPFGNEEVGRSQVVLTEVRDSVHAVLPSLMRVFFGPQHVVEFVPDHASAVEQAKLITEVVRHVFMEENAGFMATWDVLKDGLVRKMGIFKWGWDERPAVMRRYEVDGLEREQAEALTAEPGVTLTSMVQDPKTGTFALEFYREAPSGRVWVSSVPPEELIFTRDARDRERALCIAHRSHRTRGELLALGVSLEDIEEHGGSGNSLDSNPEATSRNQYAGSWSRSEGGDANEPILYIEGYPFLDVDGDGVAELVKICTIGPGYHIVHPPETVEERPFAFFCPDPEPHTLIGGSWADRTMDMQLIKSTLFRATLDSLALSLFPRMGIVEGKVNVQDVLNTEIGAIIRMKEIGAAQPFITPFVGKEALPILAYTDEIVERRTAQNKGVAGLDADALQSSTKEAVTAAVGASQAAMELMARIFAETTFKPLFRGILGLLVSHQSVLRDIRLRSGQWVTVDPRSWNADLDVSVNVALGNGMVEGRIASLMGIAAKQEAVFATFGIDNPLVKLPQYSETMAQLTELGGHRDVGKFFTQLPPDWQPPPPPPAEPSPEMIIAQVEQQKAQTGAQKVQSDAQLKAQEYAIKERELDMDASLKAQTLEVSTKAKMDELQERLAFDREKLAAETELKRLELEYQFNENERQSEVQEALEQSRAANDAEQRARSEEQQSHAEQLKLAVGERDAHLKLVLSEREADRSSSAEERQAQRDHERELRDTERETAREKNRAKSKTPAPTKPKAKHATIVRDKDGKVSGINITEAD